MNIHNTLPDDASPLLDALDGPMIHSGEPKRPSADAIVMELVLRFGEPSHVIMGWMRDIDWREQ
jgi:hypothetical protein